MRKKIREESITALTDGEGGKFYKPGEPIPAPFDVKKAREAQRQKETTDKKSA